jgi:hypothetical protein
MAPPTPPRSERMEDKAPRVDENMEDEAPVSIASLRSRFESLAAGGSPKPVPAPSSAKPVPLPRTSSASASRDTGPVPIAFRVKEDQTASEPVLLAAPPVERNAQPSPVSKPPLNGSSAVSRRDGNDSALGGEAAEGGLGMEVTVSVQAMKDRFGGGAVAGPSKPKPIVPPKSAALTGRARSVPEPLPAPIIQRISTEGALTGPESPILDQRSTLESTTLSTLKPEDTNSKLAVTSRSHPPSRSTSPKPPEPNRATKPVPRTSPSPSISPLPTPQLSRVSSTATLNEAQALPPVKTPAPKLPIRKPTLPYPVAEVPLPEPSPVPPPIPGNKPRPAAISNSGGLEAPRLPDRPRSQTVTAAQPEPALPPRPPQRQSTIAEPSPSLSRRPTRQSNLGSIRRIARAPIASVPMVDDDAASYQPPPPPSRVTAGSTPPRRLGSVSTGPPAEINGEESGEDDDDDDDGAAAPAMTTQAQRMLEDFPDSTNANRRPASFMPDVKITPTHQIYAYAVHGRYVCTGAHHVKVYDTLMSNSPILVVDLKDTGLEFRIKEPRVTAMGFRPAATLADEGRYLWCGTKDGHLWELDIRTGEVTNTKQGVHSSPVVHILRYRHFLITLEENGKLHVFEVDRESDGPMLLLRTVRVSDRFTFARLIGGKLWTASAPPNRSSTNSASKGPTIRVYEPCAPVTMPPAKTIYATEWTGAVTSATMIPFRPNEVYLAHEGGYISVWDSEEFVCLQVLKISSTDILALEGVGERLWTGNRKGQISVYDITERPWKTTNIWTAHQ